MPFDRNTDGSRERALMKKLRSGSITPRDLPTHVPPFFMKIQIQTISSCNAHCSVCPWPDTATTLPQGSMAEGIFSRIVEQLPGKGVERTSLFLMNEPLLDKRLEILTIRLKRVVPETTALIFTNGLLLDERRAESLAAAGMDEINISVLGFEKSVHERMMGIDHGRLLSNLIQVAHAGEHGRLGEMKIRVISLEMGDSRKGLEAFLEETGLPVIFKPVTNRAGNLKRTAQPRSVRMTSAPRACQRPFVKAYVLYNGDMVLCNCDWRRTTILGNVKNRTLEELWRGPQLMRIRGQHVRGELPEGELCARCDYPYLP